MKRSKFAVAGAIVLVCLATVRNASAEGLETSQPDAYSNDFAVSDASFPNQPTEATADACMVAVYPTPIEATPDACMVALYPTRVEAVADEDDCIVASYTEDTPARVASAFEPQP